VLLPPQCLPLPDLSEEKLYLNFTLSLDTID